MDTPAPVAPAPVAPPQIPKTLEAFAGPELWALIEADEATALHTLQMRLFEARRWPNSAEEYDAICALTPAFEQLLEDTASRRHAARHCRG